jgi:hypothetical protein
MPDDQREGSMHTMLHKPSSIHADFTRLALVATLFASGCALEATGEGVPGAWDDPAIDQQALALAESEAPVTLEAPSGVYFADVAAHGSGCPENTSRTSISSDGQVFTTTFSQFELQVTPAEVASVSECQLNVKLRSPAGLSYAVYSFYYSGYALLEEGVNARQSANYYFQGVPLTSREVRTDLVGPRDETYIFSDEIATPDNFVWSPCGVERDLQIVSRLRLQNANPGRSGFLNVSSIDASAKMVFKLAWKKCAASPAPSKPTQPTPAEPAKPTQPTKPPPKAGLGDVVGGVGDIVGGVVGGLGGVVGGLGGILGALGNALGLSALPPDQP